VATAMRSFEFFASLKLAVVLLTMLIIAAIAGTLYESSFDAKVARAYVYGSAVVQSLACFAGPQTLSALRFPAGPGVTSRRISYHTSRVSSRCSPDRSLGEFGESKEP